jgi:hypothetical protein
VISTILAAIANNFAILWPQYWAQYGFLGTAPTVPFFYGPKYLSQQTAPPQIVVVLSDEPFVGSEVHNAQPSTLPRELSRIWTRINFYCWGAPSVLPNWAPTTAEEVLDPIGPTTGNQNGYWFQCTTPGTTGSTEPAWPSTVGSTVSDGSAVWTCMGLVDAFRIYDTDQTDLMRITLGATLHYTLVGSYKPVKGTWYEKSDLLVFDGTVNRVSFDVLIPIPDLTPDSAVINSTQITGQVSLLS